LKQIKEDRCDPVRLS